MSAMGPIEQKQPPTGGWLGDVLYFDRLARKAKMLGTTRLAPRRVHRQYASKQT